VEGDLGEEAAQADYEPRGDLLVGGCVETNGKWSLAE